MQQGALQILAETSRQLSWQAGHLGGRLQLGYRALKEGQLALQGGRILDLLLVQDLHRNGQKSAQHEPCWAVSAAGRAGGTVRVMP